MAIPKLERRIERFEQLAYGMFIHWGLGKDDFCYMSPKEIIENLCTCRKMGANYLLNVGPTASGRIPDYEAAALYRVGGAGPRAFRGCWLSGTI